MINKLSVEEFNVVTEVTSLSKMDSAFDLADVEQGKKDYFIDFDENKKVSLKVGLEWLNDGLVEPTISELSQEQRVVLLKLLTKFGYENGELENRIIHPEESEA